MFDGRTKNIEGAIYGIEMKKIMPTMDLKKVSKAESQALQRFIISL